MSKKHSHIFKSIILLSGVAISLPAVARTNAAADTKVSSPLVINPIPGNLSERVYSTPKQTPDISRSKVLDDSMTQSTETLVTKKVRELSANLERLQNSVLTLSGKLSGLQARNKGLAADYYTNVATISTQLQAGTTPGNPRLIGRLHQAETQLKTLSESVSQLNSLAIEASKEASEATFLLEETRAAYSLSGAVEEDHVLLAKTEDNINNTTVLIERILNTVSDDITRTSTYMSAERNNLRTLTLGVQNGDIYGKSLANHPFSSAPSYAEGTQNAPLSSSSPQTAAAAPSGPRPLAKIRFDHDHVEYEQPVYAAVNEALQQYPNARFDLIAVHPTKGNAAELAIESTKARRNAEKVLRALTQMGLPMDRIDLSTGEDPQATSNEVHLLVK